MHKLSTVLFLLVSYCYNSQTLVGVYADLGKSVYVREHGRETLSPGNAWSAGMNFHFITSKHFNPIIDLGYSQKRYSGHEYIKGYIPPDFDVTNLYTFRELHLNLGLRCNILNKKHKLFIDAAMNNNHILERSDKFQINDDEPQTTYYPVPNRYYAGVLFGIGYNFNNKFSVSFTTKKALSSFDQDVQTRLNMNCITLCYFLPILANRRIRPVPVEPNEP